jgi:hypothetical protein
MCPTTIAPPQYREPVLAGGTHAGDHRVVCLCMRLRRRDHIRQVRDVPVPAHTRWELGRVDVSAAKDGQAGGVRLCTGNRPSTHISGHSSPYADTPPVRRHQLTASTSADTVGVPRWPINVYDDEDPAELTPRNGTHPPSDTAAATPFMRAPRPGVQECTQLLGTGPPDRRPPARCRGLTSSDVPTSSGPGLDCLQQRPADSYKTSIACTIPTTTATAVVR